MINLNQLRAFYQAAKCQNVSLAAKHLFVSQPAVTAQVKLFEESCGLKLFKRDKENALSGDGCPYGGNACQGKVMICL
jgi:DNA-binding transcriptional LysR family regulator